MNISRNRDDFLDALRWRTDGEVLTAGQAGYDEARTPHFPVRIGKPVAVVRPKHADDVAAAFHAACWSNLRAAAERRASVVPSMCPVESDRSPVNPGHA